MATDEHNPHGRRQRETPRDAAQVPHEPKVEPLFQFLVDLFETGFPEKVILYAVYGPTGKRLGPQLKDHGFKANDAKPKTEALVVLTNTLVKLAQEDCDVLNVPTKYGVLAFDIARGPKAYARKLMALRPSGTSQVLAEARGEDFDDDDGGEGGMISTKLMLELLASERRDKRWLHESHAHMVSGMFEMLSQRVESQDERLESMVEGIYDRSVKYITATEAALSLAQERTIKADRAKMMNDVIKEGVGMLKNLAPAVKHYLTKGKMGVADGLKDFVDGLSDEVSDKLLGKWKDGACLEPGILDVEQVQFISGIIKGSIEPKRMTEFMASLRQDQMEKAQEVLTPSQIQGLVILGQLANQPEPAEAPAPGTP